MKNIIDSHDRPITKKSEDLLGYSAFSDQVVELFSNWKSDESLVSALYGEWGSGKTSIKNMIIEEIERQNEKLEENEKFLVLEFNPWEWENQNNIVNSFFYELVSQLDRKKANTKKLVNAVKEYINYLNSSELKKTGVDSGMLIAFLALIGGTLGLNISTKQVGELISWFLVGVSGFSLLWRLLYPVINKKKSLQEIKQRINTELQARKKPLLIVLDDLDRLEKEHLRTIIQLVKVNMDFPNTIFLLLYQKDIVEKKLTDTSQDGEEYMKKIIQLPLVIPSVSEGTIHKYLFDEVRKSNKQEDYSYRYRSAFNMVWRHSLERYFKNLRDVKRFLMSFHFHSSYFKDSKGNYTIDFMDYFVLECVKVFDRKLFSIMAKNLGFLLYGNEGKKHVLDKLKNSNNSENIEAYDNIFSFLFDKEKRNSIYRIYNQNIHERYFSLMMDDMPALQKSQLIEADESLRDTYDLWLSYGRAEDFLWEYKQVLKDIPSNNIKGHLNFILKIGDDIPMDDYLTSFFSVSLGLAEDFVHLLKKLNIENREKFLLQETDIEDLSESLFILAYLQKKFASGEEGEYLSVEGMQNFQYRLRRRLEQEFENSFIYRLRAALSILYTWKKMLPPDSKTIENVLLHFLDKSPTNIFLLLNVFKQTYSTVSAEYSGYVDYISHDTVEDFISVHKIKQQINNAEKQVELNKEQQNLIKLFAENRNPRY